VPELCANNRSGSQTYHAEQCRHRPGGRSHGLAAGVRHSKKLRLTIDSRTLWEGVSIMTVSLRPAAPADAPELGRICYEAFKGIAERHGYPSDFSSVEAGVGLLGYLTGHAGIYGVAAESEDGRLLGSCFMDERAAICGIGPVTIDPTAQDRGVGRALMEHVLERAASRKAPGVRLVQSAYHTRSFALYASLGFDVREPLALVNGSPLGLTIPGRAVRRARADDLDACNLVCRRVHGHDRGVDLQESIATGSATVVEHDGRITGYATSLVFTGHAVGETDDDVKALIGAAPSFAGRGFLVPARRPLLRWCLQHRLRVTQVMTLMSVGLYNDPAGAYLPSILF
jgi:GNAT superfamily N-acetyltransferase